MLLEFGSWVLGYFGILAPAHMNIVYLCFCTMKSSSKKALGATSKRDSTISYVQICFDPITEYLDMYYPSIQHCYSWHKSYMFGEAYAPWLILKRNRSPWTVYSHICKPLINTIAFVLYFHFLAEVGPSIIKLYSCYPLIVYQEDIIVR